MAVNNSKSYCALCSQPVEIEGFTLTDSNGLHKFCCAGCLSIYQLLVDANQLTTTINQRNNEETKK